jgi:AcrR family transcriptional regulator
LPGATTRKKSVKNPRTRLALDARRSQLVELGLREFGSRAYDDVSIDEIAKAAGISKGLLYHYFPTKRAFYVACVREAARDLLDRTDTSAEQDPMARVASGIDAYLDYVRAHGRAYATLMRSAVGVDAEIAAVVDRTREALLARLTSGAAIAVKSDAPLVQIALRGWIGFAETASVSWVERSVEAESPGYRGPPPPTAIEVRELLAAALITILEKSVRS